jgi:hypothetical protein
MPEKFKVAAIGEFRFLLICMDAVNDEGVIALGGIVNDLTLTAEQMRGRVRLRPVVSAVLRPEMEGRHLDLMAFRLGTDGKPQSLDGYAGLPLILPKGAGPTVMPYETTVPFGERGIYGFFLFDREGTFGEPEGLLATYLFGVHHHP